MFYHQYSSQLTVRSEDDHSSQCHSCLKLQNLSDGLSSTLFDFNVQPQVFLPCIFPPRCLTSNIPLQQLASVFFDRDATTFLKLRMIMKSSRGNSYGVANYQIHILRYLQLSRSSRFSFICRKSGWPFKLSKPTTRHLYVSP